MTFRESADLVKKTAQERGYTAPVLLDASGDVAGRVYGVWGPPTAYLIDRQGRLVGRIQGARDTGARPLPATFSVLWSRRLLPSRRGEPENQFRLVDDVQERNAPGKATAILQKDRLAPRNRLS